ncbi:MAG: hypothetical protein HWE26_20325 [Alteromonadaceae bacterium]|nr:hypothetical protein [Alteromonadaceae bacterium]
MLTLSRITILLVVILLPACASSPESSKPAPSLIKLLDYPQALFSAGTVIQPDDIFTLTQAQQNDFLSYFHAEQNQHMPAHQRLFKYLSAQTEGFTYKGKTYTATEAYAKQQGNCLSLAILTTALAKAAAIDVSYQKMNSAPVYLKHDKVMSISSHVRTFIYDPDFKPEPHTIVIRKPRIAIDYFPAPDSTKGNTVTAQDFVAMYYQNMAAEAIINADLDQAHTYIQQGLQVSPFNPESLNILAVILIKKARPEIAQNIYTYLYQTGIGTVTTLSNFALLKERAGDSDGAKLLLAEVDKIEDDNPYKWLDVAQRQFDKQHYSIALKYYRKAIKTAPYLAESYFGMARTLYLSGKPELALNYMRKATELAYVPEQEKRYSAKLYSLKSALN